LAFPNGARFTKKGIFFAPELASDVDFLLHGSTDRHCSRHREKMMKWLPDVTVKQGWHKKCICSGQESCQRIGMAEIFCNAARKSLSLQY
jgi:hypothetical protein